MWVDLKVASASASDRQRARQIRRPHRWSPSVGPNNFAIDDVKRFGPRLHQFGGSVQRTAARSLLRARRVASPHITVTREANAPMPLSIRSVWPWITRILA